MISRTHLQLRVCYAAPACEARRVLRVLPLSRAGQNVRSESWRALPEADEALEKRDAWRNRRLMLFHRALETFEFEMEIEVETAPLALALRTDENLGQWKLPSRAVDWGAELLHLGRENRGVPAFERAGQFCALCFERIRYDARANPMPASASQIWARQSGSCADFAHVFLALCRASGLAARYVAGYNPAEGQLHAWAEVLIDKSWRAFDPTHGRAPTPGCVVVGVARDFYDLPPHTGSFRGAGEATLWLRCRTRVEPK